jgi:hypothetical protein
MKLFNAVNVVIQDMAADGSIAGTTRADADTSFSYLSSFEFVFVLCMMKEILEITEGPGQALQLRSQDIVNVVRLVSATKECLLQLRSDDGWEQFFFTVVDFCVEHGTTIPDMGKLISCVEVEHGINLIISLRSNIFEWRYSVQLLIASYMNWIAGSVRR